MSATTVKLLQAAAEIVGSERALAFHLGIGESLLARYLDDSRALPDRLLLRAVDIILTDRQSRLGLPSGLPRGGAVPENPVRASRIPPEGGDA